MLLDPSEDLRKASTDAERLQIFKSLEENITDLTGDSKSSLVTLILENLDKEAWNENVSLRALEILKILGRDVNGSDALFCKKGLDTLTKISGLQDSTDTCVSREALKCIANCLLLDDRTKGWLEEADTPLACCRLLQLNDLSMDAQFLTSRILFLMTAESGPLFERLLEHDIASALQKILSNNVAALKSKELVNGPFNPASVISEALKLHYNLIKQIQEMSSDSEAKKATLLKKLIGCITPILTLVLEIPFPEPFPLSPPHSHAIHSLMLCKPSDITSVWKEQPSVWQDTIHNTAANTLLSVLEKSIEYSVTPISSSPSISQNANSDAALASLVFALNNLLIVSPLLKEKMGPRLLPDQSDREKPVHKGDSLSARLVSLMTASATLGNAGKAVGEMLFTVCDQDANKFVRDIGYGNAVGFLLDKGIAVEVPEGCEDEAGGQDINPITGQFISSEHKSSPSLADMTDEEKEREAERLFVLFDRLKKTGVVDFENPIAKAMRENHEQLEKLDVASDDED